MYVTRNGSRNGSADVMIIIILLTWILFRRLVPLSLLSNFIVHEHRCFQLYLESRSDEGSASPYKWTSVSNMILTRIWYQWVDSFLENDEAICSFLICFLCVYFTLYKYKNVNQYFQLYKNKRNEGNRAKSADFSW